MAATDVVPQVPLVESGEPAQPSQAAALAAAEPNAPAGPGAAAPREAPALGAAAVAAPGAPVGAAAADLGGPNAPAPLGAAANELAEPNTLSQLGAAAAEQAGPNGAALPGSAAERAAPHSPARPSGATEQPAARPGTAAQQVAPNVPARPGSAADPSAPKNSPSVVVAAHSTTSPVQEAESDKPEVPRPQEPARTADERTRAFNGTFEAEPRDSAWADEQEPGIRQLMAAAGVASEDLTEVVCRRSVCKLTFKAPQLPEDVAAALQTRIKAEFGDTMLETHDPQSTRPAHLYILRSGFALQPPAP